MVDKLFASAAPPAGARLLDPGCGEGEFIAGVIRWCAEHRRALPHVIGVEADPRRASVAAKRFAAIPNVEIRNSDFLASSSDQFDFIIGNPPYVPITDLTIGERDSYRSEYATARGRFDLYLLFFEQSLRLLKPDGRLVFITPEKFLYVDTAEPLRHLLLIRHVDELDFLDEETFADLVTYPLVSTIGPLSTQQTIVLHRDRRITKVNLEGTRSWLPLILGGDHRSSAATLSDACIRISCGVATGADSVFVMADAKLPPDLCAFAHPTISGRQLTEGARLVTRSSMLIPYDEDGSLLPEWKLEGLGQYLKEPARHAKLIARTCVLHKPWYAFHENPPMVELLRPKLLCKDITASPFFVPDYEGKIIPRHSVYYIVPRAPSQIDALAAHLNSPASNEWLRLNCQRAAKAYLRLQSQTLKRLPIPVELVPPFETGDQLRFAVEPLSA
jgi:SAM-dependent methyltransferase